MQKQTVVGDIPTTTEKKAIVQKEKSKGKVSIDQGELSQKATVHLESDEEINQEEIVAYIKEGENAGGEFPINKDVTLRQDVLANHLVEILVSLVKMLITNIRVFKYVIFHHFFLGWKRKENASSMGSFMSIASAREGKASQLGFKKNQTSSR